MCRSRCSSARRCVGCWASSRFYRPFVRARFEAIAIATRTPAVLRALQSSGHGVYAVRPVGGSGSHLIASLAASNALIVVPEAATEVDAGAAVSVLMLERRQQENPSPSFPFSLNSKGPRK